MTRGTYRSVGGTNECGAASKDEQYAELLVKKVDGKNVNKHLVALQAIATANGGTRAAGTKGYDLSVAYVAK